jgi:predicted RNA-binding Zn ribbon-like protein
MTTVHPWAGDDEAKPAPGALQRVQGLINTVDLESGRDRLADARDAGPWLVDNELLTPGRTPDADDLGTVRAVREALRSLVVHNSGGMAPAPADMSALRDLTADVATHVIVDANGAVTVAPVGDGLRARLLGLLLVIGDAQRDGTWIHLKACANDDCRWAFYDRSRNHGGTWCDMASCGNKLKNRDFRARRRSH